MWRSLVPIRICLNVVPSGGRDSPFSLPMALFTVAAETLKDSTVVVRRKVLTCTIYAVHHWILCRLYPLYHLWALPCKKRSVLSNMLSFGFVSSTIVQPFVVSNPVSTLK